MLFPLFHVFIYISAKQWNRLINQPKKHRPTKECFETKYFWKVRTKDWRYYEDFLFQYGFYGYFENPLFQKTGRTKKALGLGLFVQFFGTNSHPVCRIESGQQIPFRSHSKLPCLLPSTMFHLNLSPLVTQLSLNAYIPQQSPAMSPLYCSIGVWPAKDLHQRLLWPFGWTSKEYLRFRSSVTFWP